MKPQCPECGSRDTRQLAPDTDQFICKKCGDVFDADDSDIDEDDLDEEERD